MKCLICRDKNKLLVEVYTAAHAITSAYALENKGSCMTCEWSIYRSVNTSICKSSSLNLDQGKLPGKAQSLSTPMLVLLFQNCIIQ